MEYESVTLPRPKVSALKPNSKATLSAKSVSSILDDIGNGLRTIESNMKDQIEVSEPNDFEINNQYLAAIAYGRLLSDVSKFLHRECLGNFASTLRSDQLYLNNRNLSQVDNTEVNRLENPQLLSSLLTRLAELEEWLEV